MPTEPKKLPNDQKEKKDTSSMFQYASLLKTPPASTISNAAVELIPTKKACFTNGIPRVAWTEKRSGKNEYQREPSIRSCWKVLL